MILKPETFPKQNDLGISDLPPYEIDADSHGESGSSDAGEDDGISPAAVLVFDFTGRSWAQRYGWVQVTLAEQWYFFLAKQEGGTVCAFLSQGSEIAPAANTSLIRSYRRDGEIRCIPSAAALPGQVHIRGFLIVDWLTAASAIKRPGPRGRSWSGSGRD